MTAVADRLAARMRAMGRPWELAVFFWTPALVFAFVLAVDVRFRSSLGDWEIFRHASQLAVHGRSPFSVADPAALAHNDRFVYPPITALLITPFAALPDDAGRVLVFLLTLACVPLALRLLGVRDWRCYGIALLTAPVLDSVSLGALSSVLLLGVAAAWRYRDRRHVAAATTAVTAVAKLFVWPLFVWLLATRRLRTAVEAGALALVLLLGGWAAIGFAGLRSYPHLLHVLSQVEAVQSFSLVGLLRLHGGFATALTALLAVAVVVAVVLAARGEDGDRRSLAVAVAGALLATPVLWLHYFVLLFVPIAFARPRLSALWFAPLAFWVTPLAHSDGSLWRTCFALAVAALIVCWALRPATTSAGAARGPALGAARRALGRPAEAP
ncbi:MAG TPA: glycosyltransferase family 87 protein [Gaiellaceae bacterium]